MIFLRTILVAGTVLATVGLARAAAPADYQGRPFADAVHRAGPPCIPGIVQCALYDLGGEGVAYHDTDARNNVSGKVNLEPGHQRAHASAYVCQFRQNDGVDLSFVKDWADLNHTNLVNPPLNQLSVVQASSAWQLSSMPSRGNRPSFAPLNGSSGERVNVESLVLLEARLCVPSFAHGRGKGRRPSR